MRHQLDFIDLTWPALQAMKLIEPRLSWHLLSQRTYHRSFAIIMVTFWKTRWKCNTWEARMQTAHNDSIEISERFHFQHPVFRFPFSADQCWLRKTELFNCVGRLGWDLDRTKQTRLRVQNDRAVFGFTNSLISLRFLHTKLGNELGNESYLFHGAVCH